MQREKQGAGALDLKGNAMQVPHQHMFGEGSRVWIRTAKVESLAHLDKTLPWLKGKVQNIIESKEDDTYDVKVVVESPTALADVFVIEPCEETDVTAVVNSAFCRTRTEDEAVVDDLVNSDILHEPSVIRTLGLRYAMDNIYTYSGQILIAVNPFKPLRHLYGPMMMSQYVDSFIGELSPHVYAIAEEAYKSMLIGKCPQSILISGESGAGKTESAKLVMQYLAMRHTGMKTSNESPNVANYNGKGNYQSVSPFTPGVNTVSTQKNQNVVEQQILESNPLLEAFGNANTVRNANSSRFGKYVSLNFNAYGKIQGASIQTYLLERSRIVSVSQKERGYHVFYQLCKGASAAQREMFRLQNMLPSHFAYLSSSDTFELNGIDDAEEFIGTQRAMTAVGISQDYQDSIFKTVSSILHLGNIGFIDALESHSAASDGSIVHHDSEVSLCAAAELLGVSRDDLEIALTTRTIVAPDSTFRKGLAPHDAIKARDSLSKTLYVKLFKWVVDAINTNIYKENNESTDLSISILDIYGFESFDYNCFEQLCINLANEHLQQHFNEQVLRYEQEEYSKEGIDWTFVDFKDNQEVLDLILGKGAKTNLAGIMPILDECCRLPKTTASDFAHSLKTKLDTDDTISFHKKWPTCFEVNHYAGPVRYNTEKMIEKNKDYVVLEHTRLAESSKSTFIKELLLVQNANESQSQKKSTFKLKTVTSHFTAQLKKLMADLIKTQPHYIRCIKPNFSCSQAYFVAGYVNEQLCYGGVIEAIRIARSGFPSRRAYGEFVQRYSLILQNTKDISMDAKMYTEKILKAVQATGWELGYTKVFMKEGVVPLLENRRNSIIEGAVILIQSYYRTHLARTVFKQLKESVILIQACWRRKLAYNEVKRRKEERAALHIQSFYRMVRVRRKYWKDLANRKAIIIQAYVRGMLARKASEAAKLTMNRKLQRQAAIVIQTECRRYLARKIYEEVKSRALYVKNLEDENRDLKLKMEEFQNIKEEPIRQEVDPIVVQFTIANFQREGELLKLKEKNKIICKTLENVKQDSQHKDEESKELILQLQQTLKDVRESKDKELKFLKSKIEEIESVGKTASSAREEQIAALKDSLEQSKAEVMSLQIENSKLNVDKKKLAEDLTGQMKLVKDLAAAKTNLNDVQSPIPTEDKAISKKLFADKSPPPLSFERLHVDKQNIFLDLVQNALKSKEYIGGVSCSGYWISLALWNWAKCWNPTELQVVLDTLPTHILGTISDLIGQQEKQSVYYLLNTVISISILTKLKPPFKDLNCCKASEVQLAVFSVGIGPDNSKMFNKLRQMLCKMLRPASLVVDSSTIKTGGASRNRLLVPAAVKTYLDEFESIVLELKGAHIQNPLIKALVLDILCMTDTEVINQILLRRECCCTSSARLLDLTLRQIEKWCLTFCSDLNISSAEIKWCLKRSLQACAFLLVHKTDIARAYKHGIPLSKLLKSKTDKLNIQQVYRLVAYHHDDWILGNRINSDSIALLQGLKREVAKGNAGSGFQSQGSNGMNGSSPNHAAVTWVDDTESNLLVDIDSQTINLQSEIAEVVRSYVDVTSQSNMWLSCLRENSVDSIPEALDHMIEAQSCEAY